MADEADRWIGRVVDNRYRVLARLGAGGMGVVYRVEHLRLGKIAAMKVLNAETAAKPDMVQRFRQEATAVSALYHPNIVQTFDFGQVEDALYLVMEFVKGEDLSATLKREGPLSFERAARLFVQACSALTEAHDHGIIHRDLKPENLMVHRRRDGGEHVKVLDFGLAKLRESDESSAITTGKQILGTPYYMAPEQVRGERLDPRADVYSLGATMYRALTGTPPYEAASPIAVLSMHITNTPDPPRQRAPERALPPEADEIVLRAMAKSVNDRYESAAALQLALERFAGTASSVSVPVNGRASKAMGEAPTLSLAEGDLGDGSDPEHGLRRGDLDAFERSMRRRRVRRWAAVPLALAALVAGGFGIARWRAEKPATTEREPNNTAGYANLLATGRVMRGAIGARDEGGHGDVDYYRVPPGKGARAVEVRLDGVPKLDLVLELYDGQGRPLAKGDAHGRGGGEWLQPISIGPTEAFIAVREWWVSGTPATEAPTDLYELTVTWGPPAVGWEVEPNDWEASATPLPPGTSMRGYLGHAEDKDWFTVVPATAGTLTAHVTVPAGVDVELLPGAFGKRAVNKNGAGEDEEASVEVEAGRPVLVGLARKLPARKDQKEAELAGLDAPYELRVEVKSK